MKKTIALFIVLLITVSLFSCGKKNSGEDYSEPGITDEDYSESKKEDDGKTVVIIDPGHGFDDTGCFTEFMSVPEKDLTLDYANTLKAYLEKNGATVIFTHDGESFPDNSEIISEAEKLGIDYDEALFTDNNNFSKYERQVWINVLAEKYNADFFVSLHINSIEDADYMTGTSVDYWIDNDDASMLSEFCENFSDSVTEKNLTDEVKIYADTSEDAFVVTRDISCPATLIEIGYASNKYEAQNIQDSDWQNEFCACIGENILGVLSE